MITPLGLFPITLGIPEPSTWAMMLAGLGFASFVARRKVIAVG